MADESQRHFRFPFEPYPVQQELMNQLYDVCTDGGVGVFESPTGTGKSLSVICSALQWREDCEAQRKLALLEGLPAVNEGGGGNLQSSSSSSLSTKMDPVGSEPDWLRDWDEEQTKAKQETALSKIEAAQERLRKRLQMASDEAVAAVGHSSDSGRKFALLAKIKRRARVRKRPSTKRANASAAGTSGSAATDLVDEYFSDPEEMQRHLDKFAQNNDDIGSSSESDDASRGDGGNGDKKQQGGDKKHRAESETRTHASKVIIGEAVVTIAAAKATPEDDPLLEEEEEEDTRLLADWTPKVFYCSRTHSQLAQFVREVGKTSFRDEVRVASLGSRKTLCVNPAVKNLGSELRINDACLDLQQKKAVKPIPTEEEDGNSSSSSSSSSALGNKRKLSASSASDTHNGKKKNSKDSKGGNNKGCPFLGFESQQRLVRHTLSKVMDIEEVVGSASVGKRLEGCAYYASREAAKLAHLVVLPYTSLLHQGTRESLGISLKGNVVVLDEAHNIIETINAINSARVTSAQVATAHEHVGLYLDKYRTRLKGKNILYLNQIRQVTKALLRFFTKSEASFNADNSTSNLGCSRDGVASLKTKATLPSPALKATEKKHIFTINDLLFELGIDNINLLKLERYLEQSQLPRKLLMFMTAAAASSMVTAAVGCAASSAHTGNSSSTDASEVSLAAASAAVDTSSPPHVPTTSVHVSPLAVVHRFVMCLMSANADGRIVAERTSQVMTPSSIGGRAKGVDNSNDSNNSGGSSSSSFENNPWALKFVLLNPAIQFQKIVEEAQAVVLVGGTMQPFSHIAQQLLAVAPTASPPALLAPPSTLPATPASTSVPFRAFACGHVIPPSSILPLAVQKGPSGVAFDFTFGSRGSPRMMDELGRLLVNVCSVVPKGIVVFLPSYEYEKQVVAHWSGTGCLSRLASKKAVFREPRSASEVDSTLTSFTRAVQQQQQQQPSSGVEGKFSKGDIVLGATMETPKTTTGAILFCVVGAKMSEGINFSDDLARCVVMVGLPYPDRSDPELIQKIDYLNKRQQTEVEMKHKQEAISNGSSFLGAAPSSSLLSSSKPATPNGSNAGNDYYENLCMRAVNQSIGRSIRHVNDYSSILLVDQRWRTKPRVQSQLPKWIGDQVRHCESFGAVVRNLREFFVSRISK